MLVADCLRQNGPVKTGSAARRIVLEIGILAVWLYRRFSDALFLKKFAHGCQEKIRKAQQLASDIWLKVTVAPPTFRNLL